MRCRPRRHTSVAEGGAAAVEFALVLPILLVLLYGVLEFGTIFTQTLGSGNGAREGARYAATAPDVACNDGTAQDVLSMIRETSDTLFFDSSRTDADLANIPLKIDVYVGASETAARDVDPVCSEVSPGGDAVCAGSSPSDRVYVITTYRRGLSIPFGPVMPSFEVTGKGVFPCEYQ